MGEGNGLRYIISDGGLVTTELLNVQYLITNLYSRRLNNSLYSAK